MIFSVETSRFINFNPQGQFTPQHSGTGDVQFDVHDLKCYRLSIFTDEFKGISQVMHLKHTVFYFGAYDLVFYFLGRLLGLC